MTEPTISQIHLRFHCVSLGTSCSGVELPSLVYVEDISTNGSYLYRSYQLSSEPFSPLKHALHLLEDSDQLRVCSVLTIVYRECRSSRVADPRPLIDDHQIPEKQVAFINCFQLSDVVRCCRLSLTSNPLTDQLDRVSRPLHMSFSSLTNFLGREGTEVSIFRFISGATNIWLAKLLTCERCQICQV